MDKTTPRPWKINGPWIIARELLNDGNWHEREVATAGIGWRPSDDNNANAALIVKAVNSYDATQSALKALVEAAKGWQALTQESRGLDGYHRNGDVAEWEEFSGLLEETNKAIAAAQEVLK